MTVVNHGHGTRIPDGNLTSIKSANTTYTEAKDRTLARSTVRQGYGSTARNRNIKSRNVQRKNPKELSSATYNKSASRTRASLEMFTPVHTDGSSSISLEDAVRSRETNEKSPSSKPAPKGRNPGPGLLKVPTFRFQDSIQTATPKISHRLSAIRYCFFKAAHLTGISAKSDLQTAPGNFPGSAKLVGDYAVPGLFTAT